MTCQRRLGYSRGALWSAVLLLAAVDTEATDVPALAPRLLACDAAEGIAVVSVRGKEHALLRGEALASGDWRLTQVASGSAVFAAIEDPGTSVRVFLESSGRPPLRMTDRPPSAPVAVALDIQQVQPGSDPPEAP